MNRPRGRRFFIGLVIIIAFLTAAVFLLRSESVLFDMSDATSIKEKNLFGYVYDSVPINGSVTTVASDLSVSGESKKAFRFELDSNFLFKSHRYSEERSAYFDLVGVSKLITSGDLNGDDMDHAKNRFISLWEKMSK